MFSLNLRGCVRLDKVFYCAQKMEPGKSVTIEAAFRVSDSDVTVIEPIE
jgi:hypothetical protein